MNSQARTSTCAAAVLCAVTLAWVVPARAGVSVGAPCIGSAGTSSSASAVAPKELATKKPSSSVLPGVAVVIPGLIVHGSGHLAAGAAKTGWRLLALEGTGLGLVATGGIPLVLSGASRRLVGPAAALTVVGVGLFAISFLADLYGVAAPEGGAGAPSAFTPTLQTALGYRYVYDPIFDYRHFATYEIDYRAGRWQLQPSAWLSLDDSNARFRALAAHRFIGPRPKGAPRSLDGSFLDLETALTWHQFGREEFATTTAEVAVAGRLDMGRVGPSLTGSFAEMSLGWAGAAYSYERLDTSPDVAELLLARFGYGMYVGWPGAPRGEVTIYYDHRHDGFAAGLKIPGLGSGVAGHFGASARYYLSDQWGIAAEAVAGSAYVTGLSLLFRHGEPL